MVEKFHIQSLNVICHIKILPTEITFILNSKVTKLYMGLEFSNIWISTFSQWSENIAYVSTTIFCRKKIFSFAHLIPHPFLWDFLQCLNHGSSYTSLPKNCKKQKMNQMWAKNSVTFYKFGLKGLYILCSFLKQIDFF